jgi:hypothetical protein
VLTRLIQRRALLPFAPAQQIRQPRDVHGDAVPRLVGRWRWCDKERPAGAGLVGVANAPSVGRHYAIVSD